MRSISHQPLTVAVPPEIALQAVLGVVQNSKNLDILAFHYEGGKLVAFEKAKASNPKIITVGVEPQGPQTVLHINVGTDPRTRKALLDGKFNAKAAGKFVEAVQGAIDGTAPAPASPVPNHYVQKKTQVPWVDHTQEPEIDLGFSWLGLVAYMR